MMTERILKTDLDLLGRQARAAAQNLALAPAEQKQRALLITARMLREQADELLAANAADLEQHQATHVGSWRDRMQLTWERIAALAAEVERLAALPDPVGERFEQAIAPNGLRIHKRRVPLGVIGMIYEARPTVTVEVATLCLKAGNATILRGGSETQHTNAALTALVQSALAEAGLPENVVQSIADPDRALIRQLLRLDQYIDVLIPRGGASLQQFCRQHATIPVIISGTGVCHIYIDQAAEPEQALPIVRNAKTQLPTGCNAVETVLVHRAVAAEILPRLADDLLAHQVELRVDEYALALLHAAGYAHERIVPAQPSDFGTEFLAPILAIRVVDDLAAAIEHIAHYGSGLTDAILTDDSVAAQRFVQAVDSAMVLVNASTRFNDAGELGLDGELALSTQRLHVRGPVTLRDLTTYKWVVEGAGHVRR
ncbi:MAG TPA: glutamate-5-semialdehyde dehydrogenase [Herpetosiphonaceae bacterium]